MRCINIRYLQDETKSNEDIQFIELQEKNDWYHKLGYQEKECYELHILNCITSLRKKLLGIAKEKGMNHGDTLCVSQVLDVFISHYQRLK